MKIIGLMLVRNEDWVLPASLPAALDWCDEVAVVNDDSSDHTGEIVSRAMERFNGRVAYEHIPRDGRPWDEMHLRERTLALGRALKGTHFAIIDGDEIPTANLVPHLRKFFSALAPGQCLDLPMVPVWASVDHFRNDRSVWCSAKLTLGFRDADGLTWKPKADGYQHHNRPPSGCLPNRMTPVDRGAGGVMHLQFLNQRRLLAKHVLYRMVDHLRWPGRESAQALNWKYDQALDEKDMLLSPIPSEWWKQVHKESINLRTVPWQEAEVARLLEVHGRDAFAGLDLKGF